ncbi:MAG: hypothetical protein SNJ77_01105, partial [Cytophagales bacterium]
KDGEEKVVLIEVQKAKVLSDIGRFRRYLASQYNDSKNLRETAGKEIVGLPIISIYFLGYNLGPFMNSPIINVMRTCIDNYSQEELPDSDPFIESLTHDCVVVQVPLLKKFRRNKLEKLLSIFSSLDKTSQEFDHEDFPVEYRHILNRLSEMMIDEVLKESLISEKEYVEQYFKKLEASEKALSEAIEEASEERRQKEEERRLKQKAEEREAEERKQKEEERRQKEEERRQKEEERKQKEQAKSINRIMISKMQSLGMSLEEIAKEINLTVEELKELLK